MLDTQPAFRVVVAHADRAMRAELADALGASTRATVAAGAATGSLAVRLARGLQPHAIVVGAHLPDVNGLWLLPLLRAAAPHSIVAFVPPRESPRLLKLGVDRGFDVCCHDDRPADVLRGVLDALAARGSIRPARRPTLRLVQALAD